MTDTKLPVGWTTCLLEEVLKYEQPTKYIVESTNYTETGTPVLTAGKSFLLGYTQEKNGVFDAKDLPVIIFDDFTTATKFVDFPFKVKSSAMKILHADRNVDILYFYYLMQTIQYRAETHKRYWISEYAKQEVALPPLAEQKRIVGKIEELFAEVDKGIDLLKQKQAELKKYHQSVLSAAFSGKLYKTTEWQTVQLKEVCEFKSGNTIDAKLEKSTGTIPYVKVGDMNLTENSISITTSTRFVNPGDIKQNQIIPIGSIVFPKRGGAIATNKKRKVVRPIIIDLNTMALIPTQKLNTDFFYFWMQKIDLIKLSNGGNIPQINNYSFDGVEIFLPSLPEQEQIVAEIEQRFEQADILEKSIEDALESAEKLKQSILKKAFEGKLVPQNPTDEPASTLLERIKSEQTPKKGKKK